MEEPRVQSLRLNHSPSTFLALPPARAAGARTPSMIDAPGIGAEISAAVDREDLQARKTLEHAVKDQIMQRDRGLERIADNVIEIETRQPRCFGKAIGMDHHQRAELFRLLPERRECRIG